MKNGYNIYAAVPILEVKKLSKQFGKSEVLKAIDFNVIYGEVVSIIGASGSGKSTLLRCLSALEMPSKGEVFHNGYNIISKDKRVNDYTGKVAMVFQNLNLFYNMTILENCMIGILNIYKEDIEKAKKLAMESLERVGMKDYINMRPNLLSEGQKKRVALARALVMEPEILLIDDPTAELDSSMAAEVLKVISNLVNEGMTMVIVTNEVEFAREISSHVVLMENGVILQEGSPEVVFNKSKYDSIEHYLKNIEIAKNNNILINY